MIDWFWNLGWTIITWFWNAFDDVYVWIRDWVKSLTLTDLYWFLASLALINAWFIVSALTLWALEGWDLIDLQWFRNFLEWIKSQFVALASLEYISRPLQGVLNILAALTTDRRFDTDNDGFVIMFVWFVYPVIWMLTT